MIDFLKSKLGQSVIAELRHHMLREYLQELILSLIDKSKEGVSLAFVGGTALRILYDLPRFSEDLDFCLVKSDKFGFSDLLQFLKRELTLRGFNVVLTKKEAGTVKNSYIKFQDLLFPLGLTSQKNQVLSIKLEIDTSPPSGYGLQQSVINKSFLISLQHYDKPSLFAGKCHALLCRKYAKGRDYFDLLWFIGNKITPNYTLLENAYYQTENKQIKFDFKEVARALKETVSQADFAKIKSDISPFLLDHDQIKLFNRDYFLDVIEGWD